MAQKFGNEWINYSQNYYRIPISKTGLYRISFSDLSKWGISIGDFQPQNLQIFYHGNEQYIFVQGEEDGVFNSSDFIEFYAEGNDGWLDSALYENPTDVTNPQWSMITDTASYYLTWNKRQDNRRMQNRSSAAYQNIEKQSYCIYTQKTEPMLGAVSQLLDDGPFLSSGEGWHDVFFAPGASKSIPIATPHYVQSSQKTQINLRLVASQTTIHTVRVSFLDVDTSFTFFDAKLSNLHFQSSSVLPATTSITAMSTPISVNIPDKNAFSFVSVSYPRSFDFDNNQTFSCEITRTHTGAQTLLELTNCSVSGGLIVYDTVQHIRTEGVAANSTYNVLLPNPIKKSFVFISSVDQISSPSRIEVLPRFTNFNQQSNQGNYLIITQSSLYSKAQEYARYRQQLGLNPVLIDIEQLYHQFGYGIKKHPIAIKNFCKFAVQTWQETPDYLFIIGKGIDLQYAKSVYAQNLVPVLGWPSTDNLYSFGINGVGSQMRLATGRLSAKTQDDVDLYLQKIKEFESNTDIAEWKKRILHFSGGGNVSEQTLFKGYLSNYKAILQDTLLGASVFTFSKNSSDPIEVTKSDLIKQEINNGVSYLMFFGHAAATGFDQNIDQPSTYQNKGKYPLLFANSCYNGNIYLTGESSISEQWVLIRDKGMIGFLANVDLGFAYYLDKYTTQLCKNISYRNYGQAIGLSIKDAVRQCIDSMPQNKIMQASALDMTFHGDPAIKPYSFEKPDLKVSAGSIQFLPQIVSTDVDSFRVNIEITNLGRAVHDSMTVKLLQILPDNTEIEFIKRIAVVYYKDTITFSIPTRGVLGVGINRFAVSVDDKNEIDELNESNNTASTDLFISSYDMLPVYPSEFAIYPSSSVQLVASNANPRSVKQKVLFEIDTLKSFNSSFKISAELDNETGLVSWQVPTVLKDHTVYYWRVSNVSKNKTDAYNWATSSFMYIANKNGWGQSRFEQFDKNTHTYINYNTTNKSFEFIKTPKNLQCKVQGLAANLADWRLVQYSIDGSLQSWSGCQFEAAVQIAVIDPVSLKPWASNRSNYGQKNYPICSASGEVNYFFGFSANVAGLTAMTNFLRDSVPNGYYVLLYTFYSGNFDLWPESALQLLVDMGANSIRSIPNRNPYIFFVQKGTPSAAQEKVGRFERDLLTLDVNLPTNYSEGFEISSIAGPATNWRNFVWHSDAGDNVKDTAQISIWGISSAGNKVLLKSKIQTFDSVSLSDISAIQYPYIQLEARLKDASNHTPKQLKNWQLFFDPVPETAVLIDQNYLFYRDTIEQGDLMRLHIASKNISTVAMDSLRVKYQIKSQDNTIVLDQLHIIPSHNAGSLAVDSVLFNTNGHAGKFIVTAEFNPKNAQTGAYFQAEQIHFNNLFQKQFLVQADKLNPLLDITFDGVHILDGDIVSAKPEITISLLDENRFHALDDTSLFEVYLKMRGASQSQRIFFNAQGVEQMRFVPAQTSKNKASIVYKPVFDKDGKFELNVKAKDKAGNQSGKNNYSIAFEVILASSITNILNYPNPFSTATRFVFTLTGSTLPTDLRIQILTVTGHLVREIGIDELGPLHIGRNITQYAWDGNDMFGDRLANGVYYYRVFSRIGSDAINNRSTEADKFFTKGYGKMYIMR